MFVETTILVLFSLSHNKAGIKYANDLPIPVPASDIKCLFVLKASIVASTSSVCSCLYSYFFNILLKRPFSVNINKASGASMFFTFSFLIGLTTS